MPEDNFVDTLDTFNLLLVTVTELSAVIDSELVAECKMPLRLYTILATVAQAPDSRLRLYEIGRLTRRSSTQLVYQVDQLEDDGLLARERVRRDRRGTLLVLTAKGREVFEEIRHSYRRIVDKYFRASLTYRDEAYLRATLLRLLAGTMHEGQLRKL